MTTRPRHPLPPGSHVGSLPTLLPPPFLCMRRAGRRLKARVWRRRLSLLGLLLLTLGVLWMLHGGLAGGWVRLVIKALVCLEVVLMGGLLLRIDVGELAKRIMRRQS